MNISIGNDHAGVKFKEAIIQHLEKNGNVLKNHGTNDESSVDYPDFANPDFKDCLLLNTTFSLLDYIYFLCVGQTIILGGWLRHRAFIDEYKFLGSRSHIFLLCEAGNCVSKMVEAPNIY